LYCFLASVFDRVKSWWEDSLQTTNDRWGYERVNAVVVVSHGLTMRFVLMQLFSWSPTTFHAVYNADNCGIYVLRKDLTKPGCSPYCLDATNGDLPKSSIDILVKYRKEDDNESTTIEEKIFKLHDYLSVPPPRMSDVRVNIVKETLVAQNPEELQSVDAIISTMYMPFYYSPEKEGTSKLIVQGRTSLMVGNKEEKHQEQQSQGTSAPLRHRPSQAHNPITASHIPVIPEASNRWPICYAE
jgi:hypothetical protein